MRALLALARVLIRLLGWLPLSWLHRFAALPAALLYRLPWKKHRVIRRNLQLCFPELGESERRQLHQHYLVELFRLIFEAGALWHWSEQRIEQRVRIVEGRALLDSLRRDERGVLLVSGHVGNWELLNLYLSRHIDMATLYRAPSGPALDAFINQPRSRFGADMVPGDRAAIRTLLTQLRKGKAAAIAADIQPKRGEGVFVPFFGIPALTMTLVHKLACRTGCRVILTWAKRRPGGQGWDLSLIEAGEWIRQEDPVAALAGMNDWLETAIRSAPAQYLWLYKRFSRRPEGEPPRYPKLKRPDRSTDSPPSPGD